MYFRFHRLTSISYDPYIDIWTGDSNRPYILYSPYLITTFCQTLVVISRNYLPTLYNLFKWILSFLKMLSFFGSSGFPFCKPYHNHCNCYPEPVLDQINEVKFSRRKQHLYAFIDQSNTASHSQYHPPVPAAFSAVQAQNNSEEEVEDQMGV